MISVLVLNTGSSSLKYEVIDVEKGTRLRRGLTENVDDHGAAVSAMLESLEDVRPRAVGHRVVHGGTRFREPVLVDERVAAAIEELTPLAPLHNPANLTGIRLVAAAYPGVPQVAVFDTAFHHTLPAEAHTYAVPRDWGVRRFGFHGTSCAYVSREAARLLGRPLDEVNLIVLHLGNGASATAVAGGRSVDTSMGLTPLEGLVMGTRSGDVDPALPGYLSRVAGMDVRDVEDALSRDSGLLALAGAGDMRRVRQAADDGDPAAVLARRVYAYRIRKYVGAYYAVLGRVDAIVFTGGIGEHDDGTRAAALSGLDRLGIAVSPERNQAGETFVSPPEADVAVMVVPTDEEWEIARQVIDVVGRA
ncbi:acetate kinase [Nonomuraea sp. NPDC003804]|uniref:acetate/propionate family kinase n=1 Tax=Nonomuraea sp. NPDC003804 TaxID=3154547 RepID=UPI0033BBD9AE